MARVDLKDAARLMRRAWPVCALVMLAFPTVLGARAALGATPAPPAVVVSPLNGTPDADPQSQISFLGAPGSDLRDIVVTGSRSGAHAGRLRYYSTHNGASFLPSKPFTPGETVTVSANLVGFSAPVKLATTFTVDSPYVLPPQPPYKPVPETATNVLRFHSRTDLVPPAVAVTTPAADPAAGDIFVSPDSGPGQAGAEILSPTGQPVWFAPLPTGLTAFDLNVQTYGGAPVLTWWQGHVVAGHGQGEDVIESTHYTPVATVHGGNGLWADLHDFVITPQGTAWITAFAPQHADLSAVGGSSKGLIEDGVVQEIDIKSGLVMFQWDALGHVPIANTFRHIPTAPGTMLDYFHPNSIDPLPGGDLLISSRNTWAAYLIDEQTGNVLWTLGGKQSTFTQLGGSRFAWQHDVRQLPNGTISVFDNEAAPAVSAQSRILDIAIDPTAKTSTLVSELTYPGKPIVSDSQGDIQPLANGDLFVGWGQAGEVSELSSAGALTFDMHFAAPANSYRAYRYPWSALPLTTPAISASAAGSSMTVYASWNGATGVATWRLWTGTAPNKLRPVGTFPSQGFETAMRAKAAPYAEVQAIGADGAVLRTSHPVKG
jgi:hypothetical protein